MTGVLERESGAGKNLLKFEHLYQEMRIEDWVTQQEGLNWMGISFV